MLWPFSFPGARCPWTNHATPGWPLSIHIHRQLGDSSSSGGGVPFWQLVVNAYLFHYPPFSYLCRYWEVLWYVYLVNRQPGRIWNIRCTMHNRASKQCRQIEQTFQIDLLLPILLHNSCWRLSQCSLPCGHSVRWTPNRYLRSDRRYPLYFVGDGIIIFNQVYIYILQRSRAWALIQNEARSCTMPLGISEYGIVSSRGIEYVKTTLS